MGGAKSGAKSKWLSFYGGRKVGRIVGRKVMELSDRENEGKKEKKRKCEKGERKREMK